MKSYLFAISISSAVFVFAACDPAVRIARVKPDQSIEVQVRDAEKPVVADVYRTKDQNVELQIFHSGGLGGSASISALIVNKRKEPVHIDLMQAYQNVSWTKAPRKPLHFWFVDCERVATIDKNCKSSKIEIASGESKEVKWTFGVHDFGEFVVPLESASAQADNEIRVQFKNCGSFSGECKTQY